MNVIQRVDNTLQITTEAKLVADMVVLPCGMVRIVVGGISIHKSVRKEAVEGHAPVLWACKIFMIRPFRGIVQYL